MTDVDIEANVSDKDSRSKEEKNAQSEDSSCEMYAASS